MDDEEYMSMLANNYSVNEDMHLKVISMMLTKCVAAWPKTKDEEVIPARCDLA
ncbi:MAG: hypothetical protein P4L67_03510 [Candidatus Pacebacteria bacterium]|nr:hypothetical protein [Candidatus Paceibacterota bacterium]